MSDCDLLIVGARMPGGAELVDIAIADGVIAPTHPTHRLGGLCHRVDFGRWGGIVPGNLKQLAPLAARGVVAFKAFMSETGVADFEAADDLTLYEGMARVARLGLPVAVHAENDTMTRELAARAIATGRRSVRDYLNSRPVIAETEAIARGGNGRAVGGAWRRPRLVRRLRSLARHPGGPSRRPVLGLGWDRGLPVDARAAADRRQAHSPAVGACILGRTLTARVVATILRGQMIYRDGRLVGEPHGRLVTPFLML